MIEAWKRSDTTQTEAAAPFILYIERQTDTGAIKKNIEILNKVITPNSSTRLQVRKLMYEALWNRRLQLMPLEWDEQTLKKAIQLAYSLEDDQLLAELYQAYAELYRDQSTEVMLYSLKSAELQQMVGLQYTRPIHNVFYGISNAAHATQDYKLAIQYGRMAIELWQADTSLKGRTGFILAVDMVGDSYRRMGRYDSSLYYYRILEERVQAPFRADSDAQEVYRVMASGVAGELKGLLYNDVSAIPLLNEYKRVSDQFNFPLNASLASIGLGNVYMKRKEYAAAKDAFKDAVGYNGLHGRIDIKLDASKGYAAVLDSLHQVDSAYYYEGLSTMYRDSLQQRLIQRLYSKASAQLAFESTEQQLKNSQTSLASIRKMRNAILLSELLFVVILLLLYNRYRLKQKIKIEAEQKKHEQVRQEIEAAQRSIDQFVTSIREKNDIIFSLENRLRQHSANDEGNTENLLKHSLVSEDGWVAFREAFKKAYPLFLIHFEQQVEDPTPGEERLSTLIYLKLDNYQIANTLGISKDSVARSKRRFAKRLNLTTDQSLEDFIMRLGL